MNDTTEKQFDVAIIGGALSGAATAILLLREKPDLRVLIIEKSAAFTRRVGEATVEISGFFLMRVLGLTQHLNQHHISKNGLRFWFYNERTHTLDQCSEIGGKYLSRVPSYLVDRAVLDEEVLRRTVAMGATLWRPAVVQKCELNPGAQQFLTVKHNDQLHRITARWVVDASGVAAMLARQNGWWKPNLEHPTASAWSRWKNVKDFDDIELAQKFPMWAKQCFGVRGTATNHLMGDGWWAWWIQLKDGDVSIGVTFDQRLVEFPGEGSIGERIKTFLMQHPVGREMMSDAVWTDGDVHWRKNLPYYSTTYAGDGFVLVGDAAAFIDPFYSPGMDWITYTTHRARDLILGQLNGEDVARLVMLHNSDFTNSYHRWFNALYKDKYQYFGDYELMRVAFLLDLGLYYFGVVRHPYQCGTMHLSYASFSKRRALPAFYLMSFYNRRLAKIAQVRRVRGMLGEKNDNHRFLFGGYTFAANSLRHLFKAFANWIWLEVTEGWRSWGAAGSNPMKPLPSAETASPVAKT